jgi:catechol 2,3-dioxygenase-like lactoylglutathione lyase family enzyme
MGNPILGTDMVTQVGLLVHDIEKTRDEYARFLGVEPPPIEMTGTLEVSRTKYLDRPTEARAKLAFFHVGPNVDIELIEPDKDPNSTWRHDLDTKGEGFHHIAFVIRDMKEKIKIMEENKCKLLQTGEYSSLTGRYAYVDANESLKLVIELLENDQQPVGNG